MSPARPQPREGRSQPPPRLAPWALTCRPSRSRWGVQTSVQRGRPPPATAKHDDPRSSPTRGGGGREGGLASPGPRQGEGPLTAGSPAGGPVPISMRFSGSSSSVVSSGITTTGLMCSARAEARRKLGGPCGGQTGSCSAVPQESSLCHPQSAPGTLAGSRGHWRAWGPGQGRGGVPAGTSGSRGIWMSRLK